MMHKGQLIFFIYPDPRGSEEPGMTLLANSAQPKSIYSPWVPKAFRRGK
jgi:hypothetical protein